MLCKLPCAQHRQRRARLQGAGHTQEARQSQDLAGRHRACLRAAHHTTANRDNAHACILTREGLREAVWVVGRQRQAEAVVEGQAQGLSRRLHYRRRVLRKHSNVIACQEGERARGGGREWKGKGNPLGGGCWGRWAQRAQHSKLADVVLAPQHSASNHPSAARLCQGPCLALTHTPFPNTPTPLCHPSHLLQR